MEKVLQNLIVALRGSCVRISVSESMDAMNAARLTGYSDRELLKDTLSATLAKSQHEKGIFDTCFERFFSLDGFSDTKSDSCLKPEVGLDKEDSHLTHMILSGDNAALSMSMREAAQKIEINTIWFFTQKSLYIQRILQAMGQEGLIQDIQRLNNEDSPFSRQKAGTLKAAKDLLFENVRDFVEQQYSMFAGSATEEIIERYLRHMKLSNLEQRDFHRMHSIIQKMVKRLNNLHSRRRKRSKRGWLDIKRTLRESVAYQGLLFDTRWKAKRVSRMDIMALCDVSRSVEAVSRFMLLFLYSLNEVVAKISSFIFCSNLAEVSNVFEEYQVEEAIVRLKRGIGLGIQLGRTNYGQAFLDFKKKWLDAVSNKTTVLVLGDARNNFGNPQTDILKLINERSKRVIWLNPEPPTFWGTGDSEMDRYLPYCYLAKECSTVTHLERAIDFLLGMEG
jgi:uncharacterized protein with von Willebrand factor type A (vWA) domain